MATKKELEEYIAWRRSKSVEGGRRGGKKSSAKLTKEQRIARARKAGLAFAANLRRREREAAKKAQGTA